MDVVNTVHHTIIRARAYGFNYRVKRPPCKHPSFNIAPVQSGMAYSGLLNMYTLRQWVVCIFCKPNRVSHHQARDIDTANLLDTKLWVIIHFDV